MIHPIWPFSTDYPKLEYDTRAEVLVVGGGIAGVSCAYFLGNSGFDVALIEKDRIASSTTGSSAGTLYFGAGKGLADSIDLYGRKNAKLLWEESAETINKIESIIENNSIRCGFKRPGAITAAKTKEEHNVLEKERKAMKDFGYEANMLTGKEIMDHFTGKEFHSGLLEPCSLVKPGLFVTGLSRVVNARFYEGTRMKSFDETKDGVIVKTDGGEISCDYLVGAMNTADFYGIGKHFTGVDNTMVPSKPLGSRLKELWPGDKVIWTMGDDYDLFYCQDDRTLLEVYNPAKIGQKTSEYFPGIEFDRKSIFWGEWARTEDWLPMAGKLSDRVFCSAAMGDQGLIMGFTCGRKMPELLKGEKDPFLDMVSPRRFK